MDNKIREAFDTVQAPERLKRKTRAYLRKKTFDYGRNVLQRRKMRQRLAGCLVSLALVCTGAGVWF